ncbi:uncharacterized protein LACBIDRAFT_311003 [Laccaria bicolor S238N-H82]|uniref:Predicted protein n=1 Tax=Laccaria bicolor (strain S238N-H82 / ATCC MYA-4686) TaxID=486041 RepID=B0DVI5_LACBS|nr:uncharacterized protein LACBIDRAFT_311003 [Laccaria bicolor S238N-H82]EDR01422.1 predicted protein [Laccaria bicolor S238N-H82]|eukprot:XP_001887967.1 predicted protein [Laccaria bicolor S238N-H82]
MDTFLLISRYPPYRACVRSNHPLRILTIVCIFPDYDDFPAEGELFLSRILRPWTHAPDKMQPLDYSIDRPGNHLENTRKLPQLPENDSLTCRGVKSRLRSDAGSCEDVDGCGWMWIWRSGTRGGRWLRLVVSSRHVPGKFSKRWFPPAVGELSRNVDEWATRSCCLSSKDVEVNDLDVQQVEEHLQMHVMAKSCSRPHLHATTLETHGFFFCPTKSSTRLRPGLDLFSRHNQDFFKHNQHPQLQHHSQIQSGRSTTSEEPCSEQTFDLVPILQLALGPSSK